MVFAAAAHSLIYLGVGHWLSGAITHARRR